MYKIRTVDVWDTLLRRDCHPECIKLTTALHLLLGYHDQLKPAFRNAWALYRVRIDVERSLAECAKSDAKDDEYEITQVLTRWVDLVFSDSFPADLPCVLTEFELETEIARSFPDPEIADFLRKQEANQTLFLSDFYMNASMLRRLLSAKGLDALVSDGIVSCDAGLNKRSGKLFDHVHSLHSVSGEDHVHIGDNHWSDVESPRALGVTALHYLPEAAHAERLERERLFASREVLFERTHHESTLLAQRACEGLPEREAAAFRLGADAAPMFIAFALWISEQAIVQKLDRCFFLTREGEFFYKVFLNLFPRSEVFGHKLPPATVLAVSRLSTFPPSMRDISVEEMCRVWSLFRSQSVAGLFTTFGLQIKDFSDVLATIGLHANDVISSPESSPELNALFRSKAFVDAVKESAHKQRDLLSDYVRQSGLHVGERIGVIDIGWRGSIQDNLATLFPQVHFHGMYLALRRTINPQPFNTSKSAYGPDENLNNSPMALFENFAAMEMLCSSPNGSVIKYERQEDIVAPQRHIDDEENSAFDEFTKHFQDGVILATRHWGHYIERYAVSSDEMRDTALHIWDTLRRAPSNQLVETFIRGAQHDFFGYGEMFRRDQFPSIGTILLSPFLPSRRQQLIEFIRRVQWSEAIEKARGISRTHRFMLVTTFRLANRIKRARMRIKYHKTS